MLTDDMTRLCDEIVAMRKMRGGLIREIQNEAKGRKQAVTKLCAHLGSARAAMARRGKHERVAFMNHLRRSVGAQLREMRDDLAGARSAWAGKSS
jgi:hypothetical protein